MRKLPKVVAGTDVGKSVTLKIWRNKKMIDKRLTLGRLESSSEFKEKKAELPKKTKELDVDTLKVTVRDLNSNDIKVRMEKALDALKKDLSSLRVGRASSTMLDTINVNAYGSIMPLNQISTISVPESRLLLVSVWDNSLVAITEKSIRESPLGLNPMVEGNVIRLSIPPLSEDRRIEITKIKSELKNEPKQLEAFFSSMINFQNFGQQMIGKTLKITPNIMM